MILAIFVGYVLMAFVYHTIAKAYRKQHADRFTRFADTPDFLAFVTTIGAGVWPIALLMIWWSWSTTTISDAILRRLERRKAAKLLEEGRDARGSYR